jgi:hypothetical protein
MGTWGYYGHPLEPPPREDWWEDMAEQESLEEFIIREMSYADSEAFMDGYEDGDESGYGAWMGGEL